MSVVVEQSRPASEVQATQRSSEVTHRNDEVSASEESSLSTEASDSYSGSTTDGPLTSNTHRFEVGSEWSSSHTSVTVNSRDSDSYSTSATSSSSQWSAAAGSSEGQPSDTTGQSGTSVHITPLITSGRKSARNSDSSDTYAQATENSGSVSPTTGAYTAAGTLAMQHDQQWRSVYFVRSAERTDRIFPNWIEQAFDRQGKYIPSNLNLQLKLPFRPVEEFQNDPPLTEIGQMTAQMLGRGFQQRGARPNAVFCSPALRCIQTAVGLVRKCGVEQLQVCVEPGLFDTPLWGNGKIPAFVPPRNLLPFKYPIKVDYVPAMTVDQLQESAKEEIAIEDTYRRLKRVMNQILMAQKEGPVVVVAHALTLDACARQLMGKTCGYLKTRDLVKMGVHYPYCSVVAVEQKGGSAWKPILNPLPPISYMDFSNTLSSAFFMR